MAHHELVTNLEAFLLSLVQLSWCKHNALESIPELSELLISEASCTVAVRACRQRRQSILLSLPV